MSKKDKNTVKQAVLEAIDIKNSIKEESKDILKEMLGDAVKTALRESIDDEDDDSYEVVDDEEITVDSQDGHPSKDDSDKVSPEVDSEEDDDTDVDDSEEDEEEDEWDKYSEYKTDDDEDTYDLTGVEDYDQIVKVYKLMKDTDHVVVKKDGDKLSLSDDSTGNEYVIDLGTDSNESIEGEGEEQDIYEGIVTEDEDIAGIPSDDSDDVEFVFDESDVISPDDVEESVLSDEDAKPRFENKKGKKVMKERKQNVYEVSLGYTDDYQDKDPIQGLSNNEPSKSGKSWEKGVPTGTDKPWAGDSKDKGEPFEETVSVNEEECVDECGNNLPPVEEGTNVGGASQQRSSSKSHIPSNRKEHGPKVKHHVSAEGEYSEVVESLKKEIASLKKINEAYKKENLVLKEGTKELKKNIKEAYVVNTNLAKITRLFTENVVSQDEKREIVNRFANEAKTVEQSKALYETINKELKKNNKQITLENKISTNVKNSQVINENKYRSPELLNTLDLIKRVENR